VAFGPSSGRDRSDPARGTQPLVVRADRAHEPFGAGAVTNSAGAAPSSEPIVIDRDPEPQKPVDAAVLRRRTMRYFGGAAGAVLVVGIVVILALTLTGNSPIRRTSASLPDTRPPLAKLCPPPTGNPPQRHSAPPTPAGPRTNDPQSGISYQAFGAPWRAWNLDWSDSGDELKVNYKAGQYFVTEQYALGDYLATILSASVPAATNDALTLDLKCTGKQVAADARAAFYPQPNTMESIRDEQMNLGGMPAWVSEFRLHFHEEGLTATDELVMLATIDVGRPNAAILYVSIPGTVSRYDGVIDKLLASVRPTS